MVSTHLKNMLVKLEIFPKCLPLYQRICLNNIPHFDVQRTISVNQRSQFLKLPNKKSLGYNGTYTGLEAQLRIFKAEGNSTHPKQKKKNTKALLPLFDAVLPDVLRTERRNSLSDLPKSVSPLWTSGVPTVGFVGGPWVRDPVKGDDMAMFFLFQDLYHLVSGFNPVEKHQSNWKSSPNRGENKKCLKPPPS